MHPEAAQWVADHLRPFHRVAEFGSLDINGGIRQLFNGADYIGIDVTNGPGVDVVADAARWQTVESVDCVVCCEVFEHTADWPGLVRSAYDALAPEGVFIVTAAGPGRGPHSAFDGNALRDGEHYANIEPDDLAFELINAGFTDVKVDQSGLDVRSVAVKP